MKRCLLFILFIALNNLCFSQVYYSKTYDFGFGNSNFMRSFVVSNNEIFTVTGDVCHSTGASCSTIAKFDIEGNLMRVLHAEDFRPGNEEVLLIRDDSLFISGQSIQSPKLTAQFLRTTPNLTNYTITEFVPDERYTYFNEGLLFYEGSYYSYGNGGIIANDSIIGYITKWDEDLLTVDSVFIFNQFRLENKLDDPHIDQDGNIVFLNKGIDSLFTDNKGAIVTINPEGFAINEQIFDFVSSIGVLPNFMLLDDGNYLVPEEGFFPFNSIERLIKFDSESLEVLWETMLPFDPENLFRYDVLGLNQCANGDILVVGSYEGGYSIEDLASNGFITKINNSTGEIIWHRIYHDWNLLNAETEGYYNDASLKKIVELDNGDLLAAGAIRYQEAPYLQNLWLLRLKENGCLHEEECGEENFTSAISIIETENNVINIIPNPTTGTFKLHLDEPFTGEIRILDLSGSVVYKDQIDHHLQIEIELNVIPGVYFATLNSEDGSSTTKKIVVQR